MKLNKNIIVSFIVVIGCTFLFNSTFNKPTIINKFLANYVYSDLAVADIKQLYVSNYSELNNAINTINNTTTQYEIILTNNIKLASYIQIGSESNSIIPNVILNLQSYYITSTEYDYEVEGFGTYKIEYGLINYGNLEINATTGGMRTNSDDTLTLSDMVIVNHNNMTINGGNYYDGATVGQGQIVNNYGKLTINDGNFTLKKSASIILSNSGELILNGGTFDFTNLEGEVIESFVNEENGIMTINNSNIIGGGYGIVNYNELNINGGTITGNVAAIVNGAPTSGTYNELANLYINGGSIITEVKGGSSSGRQVIYNSGNVLIDNGELKITNSRDDVSVSVLCNYGIQTINGGTLVAETSRSKGYISGISNSSNSAYTNWNAGIIKLKSSDIDQITSINTFFYGTTNIAENFNVVIKSDGNYKFVKLVDTSGYFSSREGDGSEENPYQISSVEQLDAIRYFPDKHFILMNDLNLEYDTTNKNGLFYNEGLGWDPIGEYTTTSDDSRPRGIIDGNYHIIEGLNINRPTEDYVGLFGKIVGPVKNLAIINSEIIGNKYVGSIAGYTWGKIDTVYTANNVKGNSSVGGVVGYIVNGYYPSITNVFNLGNIEATNDVGGISYERCDFCYNTGTITGGEKIGSLYGYGTTILSNHKLVLKGDDILSLKSYEINDKSIIKDKIANWDKDIWVMEEVDGITRLPKFKNFNFEHIEDIEILKKETSLSVGEKIKYQISPNNNYNTNVTFYSNDENIVSFNEDGTISALNDGYTTIGIYSLYDGYQETFPVEVNNNELTLDVIYTVTYETNGGFVARDSFEATYDSAYGELETPTKKGYTFKGWYLEDTFENQVTEETIVKAASNHTLYAKWEPASYKLTIDPNGGEYSGETELTIKYNERAEINTPIRIGHVFGGWIIDGEECDLEGMTFRMGTSDATLTATWNEITYDVTYEANGGTTENESFNVTYNWPYEELETPTKKGHTFKGWYLEETLDTEITKDTIVKTASNHTLYARWEINSYKLTINPNGGTYNGELEVTVNYNETAEVNNPTRVGYEFKGWELTGTESTLNETTFTMGISDSTLTAKWGLIIPDIEETSNYIIKNNMMTKVILGTNVEDFELGLNSIYSTKIINTKKNEEKTEGLLATGDKVQIYLGNTLVTEYMVSIKGDISGDGKISAADFSKAYQYLKGRIDIEDWFIESSDVVENDSIITMADVSKIYQFIKKRINSLD